MLKDDIKKLFNNLDNDRIGFRISQNIAKLIEAKTNNIFISAYDIKNHQAKNIKRGIGYIDYYNAAQALISGEFFAVFKDGEYHTILLSEHENIYRIVLKATKNKKEIFMPSVVKITDLENEVQKLARNKKQIK